MSNAIMDALGYVGDSLDKPGRAVRGVLAGKGREALAAVPFSDSLGITDAKDRTSGRDLTDAYGLTRSGSRSFGSHALGFGAEMLTDPLNLVAGYGAFKAAPTLAKGLTSAGKAVSGLDLLDAFQGAGKGARNLLRSEEGSLHAFPSEWGHSIDNWHAGLEPPKRNVIDGQPDTLLNHLPWGGEDNVPQSWKVAAAAAGPRYEGGLDKLQEALNGNQYKHANKLLYHPNAGRIAEEIPEGTKYLGNGAEAIAFKAPDGHVIRVSPHVSEFGSAGRADMPEILQPFRSQRIEHIDRYGEHKNPWIVEHLPEVDPLLMSHQSRRDFTKILEGMYRAHGHDATTATQHKYLQARQTIDPDNLRILGDELSARVAGANPQLDPWDFHEGNIASTREGNLIGHDGGMVRMLPSSNKTIERWSAPDHLNDPGQLEAVLKAGGPEAVREAMANGNALGTFGQGAIPGRHMDLTEYTQAQALVREFLGKNAHYANTQTPHHVPGVNGVQSSPVSGGSDEFKVNDNPIGYFLAKPLSKFSDSDDPAFKLWQKQQSPTGPSGHVHKDIPDFTFDAQGRVVVPGKPAAQSVHTKGPDNWNPDNIELIKRGLPGMDIEAIRNQVEGKKLGWFGVDDLIREAKQNLARPAQEPPLSFHIGDTPAGGQRDPNQPIPLGGAWAPLGAAPLPTAAQRAASQAPKPRVLGDPGDASEILRLFADPHKAELPWYRAAQINHAEGKATAPIFPGTWASKGYRSGSENGEALAHYLAGPKAIELNMGFGQFGGAKPGVWQDNKAMQRMLDYNREAGHFSNNHIDHPAFHELGHALHHDSIGDSAFRRASKPFDDPEMINDIQSHIGNYAASNPAELVAEMYASLRGGRQYPFASHPVAQTYFEALAGTPLLDKMSNQGLLKGIGLSALLSAYGLSSTGESPRGA